MKLVIAAIIVLAGAAAQADDTYYFQCKNTNTSDVMEPQALDLTITAEGSMALFHSGQQMQGAYDYSTSPQSTSAAILLEGVPGPTPKNGVYILNKSITFTNSGGVKKAVAKSADGHVSTFVCEQTKSL